MSHVIALAVAIYSVNPQATAAWRDPSPHKVQFVTVDRPFVWRCSIGAAADVPW